MNVCSHHSLYHISLPKRKKYFFSDEKVIERPEATEGPLRVLFRFQSDRGFLRVLSDMVLFESPVIGFSSGSSVIHSSHGSSVLFFQHATIFYQNVLLLFYTKNRRSFLPYIFKKNFTVNN